MSNRYWETEKPTIILVGNTFLIDYPQAGKMQVCNGFKNDKGEFIPGKRGVLDVEDLAATPEAIALLEKFIGKAREMAVNVGGDQNG